MKKKLRFVALFATAIALCVRAQAVDEETESFGQKTKHFFGNLWPSSGKKHKKSAKEMPTPAPSPTASASPQSSETGASELFGTATPRPTASAKQTPASNATIATDEISEYDSNLPEVRRIIEAALGLTTLNLDYRYGSADPANGGMDCSGFVHYVLTKAGVQDVPRDARDQYVWVRKAGNFQAVFGHSDDTFELNALQPGDLLFWADNNSTRAEPAITQTMIYVGREKETNKRIMIGAGEGRSYNNQPRNGVSLFDFKISRSDVTQDGQSGVAFVGYGRIPGLTER